MTFTFDSPPPSPSDMNDVNTIILPNQNERTTSSSSSTNDNNNTKNVNKPPEEEEYKLLLETIYNLQSELEYTKHENKKLTNQNQTLEEEQTKLEMRASTIQSRFNETKKSLIKLMENDNHSSSSSNGSCKREEEFKLMENKWRNLVERERKELEEQRRDYSYQLQQVESIRSQIRQEMRKECEEYIESLSKEVSYRCSAVQWNIV